MSKRISNRKKLIKENLTALKTLAHIGPKRALVIVNNSPTKFLHVFKILSQSILDGTIPLKEGHIKKLKKHKLIIRNIAKSRSGRHIKKAVSQKGGSFFKSVLNTLLPIIPMLL